MASILNKLQTFVFSKIAKNQQKKYEFNRNFLPIKLEAWEHKKEEKLQLLSLKQRDELLPYEIDAGITSDYLEEVYQDKLKKLEDRYYWEKRALVQSLKRKKSDDERLLNEFDKEKEEAEKKLKGIYYKKPSPVAKKIYELKQKEVEAKYKALMEQTTIRFDHKMKQAEGRVNPKLKVHQKRISWLKEKLISLEDTGSVTFKLDDDVVLKLDNLSMHFGGLKAVDELSFDVKEGEIFGLIGPNGAGKTTIFNCITRFYRPTFGNMYFRNNLKEIVHLNKIKVHNIVKEGISRTFQNVEMVWELNVIENLLVAAHTNYRSGFFGHLFNTRLLRQEEVVMRKKAEKILRDLDLYGYAYAYPYGLPYGILKKIELARTLMVDPKMIILDEPAAGLNDSETDNLAKTIKKIQKDYNATIFLVEHDMGLVMNICDTVCAISFGKKLAIGTPKEIQSSKIVQEAYLGGE